jgi:arsenate reductase
MVAGFLKSFDPDLEVYSAGTEPASQVNPRALLVMTEVGLNISDSVPQNVNEYLEQSFDYVITVCDDARESCPVFTGDVKEKLHIGFVDPAKATGTEDEILSVFRRVREEIRKGFYKFYIEKIKDKLTG